MKIDIHHTCEDFNSYRAARVKSLFNAESGCSFDISAEPPIDDDGWKIGVIVGPSGSGKTSMGEKIWGAGAMYRPDDWPADKPIVDAIAPDGGFDDVTGALSAVGLGTVPTWLRPYTVLSNGEKFRANLARVICERPAQCVIDEFTSVVDRQIAKFGALAFAKAWRRTGGKCVLLSCHYDVIDWIEPDWVFDTGTGRYAGRSLWRRPKFDLEIWKTGWGYWHLFEPHHYLRAGPMPMSFCYVGTVDGELVAHIGMGTMNRGKSVETRACRLVIMPEWQGAGVGTRFLNAVCQVQLEGGELARLPGRRCTTIFHTSHPGLCAALRRDKKWGQVSAALYGTNRGDSARSIRKSGAGLRGSGVNGYGGHFRAVQGFRYYGSPKE